MRWLSRDFRSIWPCMETKQGLRLLIDVAIWHGRRMCAQGSWGFIRRTGKGGVVDSTSSTMLDITAAAAILSFA